jgi:uncharacterized damage-inducible protein DinB
VIRAARAAAPSRISDVLVALHGAFYAKGWHGPSVLEALRGLTGKKAKKRRGKASHSVHEVVDHIEYWENVAIHYVRRGRPPKRHRQDWAKPNLKWRESVRRLRATHRVLVAAIASIEDADLERPVRTVGSGRMSLRQVLHGVAAHDAYHAGQIQLLRTL